MIFRPGETINAGENPLLLQQLTALGPPSKYYFAKTAKILDISRLAARRRSRVIG